MNKIKRQEKAREVMGFIAFGFIYGFSLSIILSIIFCHPLHAHDTMLATFGSGAVISTIAYLILKYA